MSDPKTALSYAALILHDDNVPITADKLMAICEAANVEVDAIWAKIFAKALEGKNVADLLTSSAPAAAPVAVAPVAAAGAGGKADAAKESKKKEEVKEESDEEMGFGLFD